MSEPTNTPASPKLRYTIERPVQTHYTRYPEYRVTDTATDSRIATCYVEAHAKMVADALNRQTWSPTPSPPWWLTAAANAPCKVLHAGDEAEPYLKRYCLSKSDSGAVYLHNFLRPDAAKDMHDHPWSFTRYILSGGYREDAYIPMIGSAYSHNLVAGDCDSVGASFRHCITFVAPDTWSLVVVGKRVREWFFWIDNKPVPWRKYVNAGGRGMNVSGVANWKDVEHG